MYCLTVLTVLFRCWALLGSDTVCITVYIHSWCFSLCRESKALTATMGNQVIMVSLVKLADKDFLVHRERLDLTEKMVCPEGMAVRGHVVSG